ncbi:pentapeptide repeat-containing protein [Spirulina sp. 06S082]|uniref:pentapeptide repeat-containing protein n=1 Tax=Spirulina sp. 06S082 TaxID=3110248 RepID=UPI002B2034C8|nr:pentapeptide repeat-containing protein [Spirulina sp. 06S082]MEA5472401.1 pentapeptide repeat-containing protein [Spirulina sp. 06S082]
MTPKPDSPLSTEPNNETESQSRLPLPTTKQLAMVSRTFTIPRNSENWEARSQTLGSTIILVAFGTIILGWFFNFSFLLFAGSLVTLLVSLRIIFPAIQRWLLKFLTPSERGIVLGTLGTIAAIAGFAQFFGIFNRIGLWLQVNKWDEFGSWADWFGALGQIAIAVLAVYVAWQQYVISKDLTMRQNAITQQQTIDSYFQGISDLALSDEGLLEDWPQERAFSEGRTAAILSSVDAAGKAKIIRFLSQSKLLTPLRRDGLLGRAILDGAGGYEEDRQNGLRVIDLGVMLARADLSETDLRWTDLSDAYVIGANFSNCDLVKANLARTVLYEANLRGADIKGTRFFYGNVETASPRSLTAPPNYETGSHTGAVIEKADFTGVQRLSEEQRLYLCYWGDKQACATIPGGCTGIPNKLGR